MKTDEMKRAARQVVDAVDDAVSTKDFSGLGETVGDLVRQITWSFLNPEGNVRTETKPAVLPQNEHPEWFFAEPDSAQGKKILGVVGTALAVIFGLMTLGFLLLSAMVTPVLVPLSCCFGAVAIMGTLLAVRGYRAGSKAERFRIYRKMLLPRLYASVRDLARAAGRTEEQTVADLENFCREGKILQGHFDEKKTCFIASDDLYSQYQVMAERERAREAAEEEERKKKGQLSKEVLAFLEKGNAYLDTILKAKESITDEGVLSEISRMEDTVRRILAEVEKRPSLVPGLGMFMNYYLPTTAKLVSAYSEMEHNGTEGENILRAKKEIADSLDSVNDAFEKILDGFFSDQAMDVSSDIRVMKMMLKQDGLTDDEPLNQK